MDTQLKEQFTKSWKKYFPKVEWPICFYYTDDPRGVEKAPPVDEWRCLIADLGKVRKGKSLSFDINALGCCGGKRYLGFSQTLRPQFEYFLSCGIEGELEGERYKKSPEMVAEIMRRHEPFEAPARYIVFKRFDKLEEGDNPQVVIFFAVPDVLSGLFTLANFDEVDTLGVIAPFGAGCASIVHHPFHELKSDHSRPVLGMFDVSARPYVPANTLTFAVPWPKFVSMVGNMEESFLITKSWGKVRRRIGKGA
jgi:hypothetical protein